MFKLEIRDDEGAATTVPLVRDEVTIGRMEGNTIRLTERNVSRRHARFFRKGPEFILEDFSRYGTQINGAKLAEPTPIKTGDVILIGDYQFSVQGEEAAQDGKPVKKAQAPTTEIPAVEEIAEVDEVVEEEETFRADSTSIVSLATLAGEQAKGRRRGDTSLDRLVVISDNRRGLELSLDSGNQVLGRTPDNDLMVDHQSISRQHARFERDSNGAWTIHNLSETNGLKVNGEYYEQSILRRGDVVTLGHVDFRFVEAGEAFNATEQSSGTAASSQRGQLWTFLGLVAVVGLLGGAYFFYFSQPSETPMAVAPTADGAPAAATENAAGAHTGASTETLKAQKIRAQLIVAQTQAATKDWTRATAAYTEALALDPENEDARRGLEKVTRESLLDQNLNAARALLDKGSHSEAWNALMDLDAPADSVYVAAFKALREQTKKAYLEQLVGDGEKDFRAKRYAKAIGWADTALSVQEGYEAARALKRKSRSALKEQRSDGGKNADKRTAKPKPTPGTPPTAEKPRAETSGESASDLYMQARKLHNSQPLAALKLYKRAAQKGHSKSWSKMGSLYLKQGNKTAAINAFRKYLRYAPGARDAQTIRDTIIRLGGSP